MTDTKQANASRRSFFMKGGAALGAGLASATAGASTLVFDSTLPLKEQMAHLQQQLGSFEDKEAIRQLHLAFTSLLENQAFETVVEFFTDDAQVELDGEVFVGKQQGIKELFTEQYAEQKASVLYTAFRQNQSQQQDELVLADDMHSAKAVFHNQVQISKPLTDASVIGQMARLQGQSADSNWVNGKFAIGFVRVGEVWKIQTLQYQAIA